MPLDATGFEIDAVVEDDAALVGLRRARAFLAAHGWCRSALWRRRADGKLAVCAIGAIRHGNAYERWSRAEAVLQQAIAESGSRYPGIGDWNDYVARSKDDVLRMFDRAIERRKRELRWAG